MIPITTETKDDSFKFYLPIQIKYQPLVNPSSKPYLGSAL